MRLTKKKAKEISVEVWQYLYDNPEIESKIDLPDKMFNKIKKIYNNCPLCEYFQLRLTMKKCPLNISKFDYTCAADCANGFYNKWRYSETKRERKKYAGIILKMIKAWEI